jgi:TonB-linked SusC/RagA family outer membrane protein
MKQILLTLTLTCFFAAQAFAQQTVTGMVTDTEGEPLMGVTVTIKEKTIGTVTNIDGEYEIDGATPEDIILFSYIGMAPEEILVGEQTTINISMIESVLDMDEVVVVGYGSVKRANLAGSVTNINAEELTDIPVSNLSTALEGRLAGVSVQIASGNPGEVNTLKVREVTTYDEDGDKILYVIDGIRRTQSDFDLLDPTEVESISVLKDASAAVYGASSGGGVILVKTKRGKEGKAVVSYNGSMGITQGINTVEMLSAYDHAMMLNAGFDIQGKDPDYIERYTERELAYYRDSIPGGGYNWMDDFWKDATISKHNLNIRGGSEKIKYFVGGNYSENNGNIDNLYVKRYSVRSNIDAQLTNRLSSSIEMSISNKVYNTPYSDNNSSATLLESTFQSLLQNPKWVPPVVNGEPIYADGLDNPYIMMASGSYKENITNSMNYSVSLNYDIPIEGLSTKVRFSQSKSTGKGKTYNTYAYGANLVQSEGFHIYDLTAPLDSANPYIAKKRPSLEESVETGQHYQANITLNYSRKIALHNIHVLAVCEFKEGYSERVGWQKSSNQVIEGYDKQWAFEDNKEKYNLLPSNESQDSDIGYIGRLNYIYANRYIVEFAGRYETSINFPESKRWGFFPSLLVGWVVSEEPFFQNATRIVNFLKIRGSAGRLGIDSGKPFTYQLTYAPVQNENYLFGDTPQLSVQAKNNAVVNPNLHWSKTNSYNGGVDIRLFDSKVSFTADGFYKYTFDILAQFSSGIATTTGADSKVKYNYGTMHGYGYELELGYHGKVGSDFKYDISGMFTWAEAKVLKVFQSPGAVGTWRDETKNYRDNQPGAISSGIIRSDEEVQDILMDNPYYTIDKLQPSAGMLNYVDIRGTDGSDGPNGVFNNDLIEDRTTISDHTSPTYHYSLNLSAGWKGIKVSANFLGQFGHDLYYEKEVMVNPTSSSNVPAFWADYWTYENPDAAYPRAYQYGGEEQYSTFWKLDGHLLRLSNLNVSYTLPSSWGDIFNIEQFRIYFNSKYLWTIINPYSYKDAYQSKYNSYPMTRDFVFGINARF